MNSLDHNPNQSSYDASTAAVSGRRIDALLTRYGENHLNPTNETIHLIAIPLIMMSLIGLLFSVHPGIAYVFVAASLVYYARLSWVFFAAMALLTALTLFLVHGLGIFLLPLSMAVFITAWIMQFVGHKIEGKKPSFFEDLQYLWIGPLFVLSKLFLKMGWRW